MRLFLRILFLAILLSSRIAYADLKIDFLDVGEGDCTIIESDSSRAIVDTGNPARGLAIVKHLTESRRDKIDSLIITHPHLDHSGAVFAFLSFLKINSIYDNGEDLKAATEKNDNYRWYDEVVRSRSDYHPLYAGSRMQIGSASMDVLWPPKAHPSRDWNADSLVIMIRYGKFSALLMGDANTDAQKMIMKTGVPLKAQVLKAAHHGAPDSASPEFIKSVSPKLVFVSVNKGNSRGYPDKQTLKRFEDAGAEVLLSYQSGNLRVSATEDGQFSSQTGSW